MVIVLFLKMKIIFKLRLKETPQNCTLFYVSTKTITMDYLPMFSMSDSQLCNALFIILLTENLGS